jgi:hypothetical protein
MMKTVKLAVLPKCDFCDKPAHYDGKTKFGPWANMCKDHFKIHGIGISSGLVTRLEQLNVCHTCGADLGNLKTCYAVGKDLYCNKHCAKAQHAPEVLDAMGEEVDTESIGIRS